jgi:predicted small metal-binding protein
MVIEVACRDMGSTCPYIARGESMQEVLNNFMAHFKHEHGKTDEELNDPEMQEKIKAAIKEK